MKKKAEITFCSHCQEVVEVEECEICKKPLLKECLDCHMELSHSFIVDQNINFFNGKGLNCLRMSQIVKLNEILYPWLAGE